MFKKILRKKITKIFSLLVVLFLIIESIILSNAIDKEYQSQPKINTINYKLNELLVVSKQNRTNRKLMKTCNLNASKTKVSYITNNIATLTFENQEELNEAIPNICSSENVEYIQPNYIYSLSDDVTSLSKKNPDSTQQWGLYNDGSIENISIKGYDIHYKEAMNLNLSNQNQEVIVAIIDTGINYNHADLIDNIWTNKSEIPNDNIDNDNNGFVDDIHGWNFYLDYNNNILYNEKSTEDDHGTHCAGTIAATDNSIGIIGIAASKNVKIMSVRVLGGAKGTGTTENIIKGIKYAEKNGASICNMSLGCNAYDQCFHDAIQDSNMLFCVSAGNNGLNIDTQENPYYPAGYDCPNIITVTNMQSDGCLMSVSNYGTTSVDIAAPGTYIYSTGCSEDYLFLSGTSMSAPMVAGVAAYIKSAYPQLSTNEIKDLIIYSATKTEKLNNTCYTNGYLNLNNALILCDHYTNALVSEPIPVDFLNASPVPQSYNVPTATPVVTPYSTSIPPTYNTIEEVNNISDNTLYDISNTETFCNIFVKNKKIKKKCTIIADNICDKYKFYIIYKNTTIKQTKWLDKNYISFKPHKKGKYEVIVHMKTGEDFAYSEKKFSIKKR